MYFSKTYGVFYSAKTMSPSYMCMCMVAERRQHLLSVVGFAQNFVILAIRHFMPKTSVKIAWHEPNDIPTSSATSLMLVVIRRLSKIIFFTALQCFLRLLM